MEKSFERHSAANDLLSQSYCNGIQKIAGTEDAITSDFHVSGEILDKRKKAWNNLFEKYSAMVSEAELNINTLQPEESMDPPEVPEQRLPMRKPMSMVQYWVDTGNLLLTNCTNNPTHSDSGSSIVEDDHCEPDQNNDSQSLATNRSEEKHSNIAEISGNKNLKIATSSNSSIDTAAYILANNNVTKKAETIAIVEGSKVDTETQSPVKVNNNITKKAETIAITESSKVDTKTQSPVKVNNNITKKVGAIAITESSKVDTETHSPVKLTPHIMEMNKNTNRISSVRKNNHEKLKLAATNFSQSLFYKSCAEKIAENIKIAKLNKICANNVNSKSKSRQSNICSIFFSDSDESISNIPNYTIQKDLNENNQNSNNVSKFLKRKKLYNRSDSPAEFTPVSEDNLSLHTSKLILRKCLPLRRSEHPALETPKTSSRYLTRTRQTKFRRKINRRQCLSSISTSDEKSENQELLDPNQNNVNSCSFYNSQMQNTEKSHIQTGSKENCIADLMLSQKRSDNGIRMKDSDLQNSINKTSSLSSSCKLLKNKLKTCKIVIRKLPYKYYSSNSSEHSTNKKNTPNSVQSKRIEDVNKNLQNYKSNIDPINNAKDLSENTCHVNANNIKTFNNTKTFGDIFSFREKETKLSYTTSSNHSSSNVYSTERISARPSEMTRNESLYKEKSKYVIADSSSDESDLIVTSSQESKSRKSKRLPGKNFSYDKSSSTTNEDSHQSSSSKQEVIMQKIGKNNDTDDDVQCFEMKENSSSRESKQEVPSRDCKNNKNKIRSTLNTSSSRGKEVSTSIKENNQAVNSATKSKQTVGSTCAILRESKNISDSMNCKVLVIRIPETSNKIDVNKKLSELAITHGNAKASGKMRNERELSVNDKSFGSDNSGDVGTISNSVSNKKKSGKIRAPSDAENSRNVQSNKSPAQQTQRQDKLQRTQYSTKLKTVIVPKTSTKKRKSLEIDLSSDEECIIPLKKKE